MRKLVLTITALMIFVSSAFAQEREQKGPKYTPKAGDWSIGFTFNPATMAYKKQLQPSAGTSAGEFLSTLGENNKQMFILSQDPLASIRFKFHISEKLALRASVGILGSNVNYREYVTDDAAVAINPLSQNKVADQATSNLNGGSLLLGTEYKAGKGALKFVIGFNAMYSIAGGSMNFKYGNVLSEYNRAPSTMPLLKAPATPDDKTLNQYDSPVLGIAYARPTGRYNVGYVQGLGLTMDMGLEWFCFDRISIGAAMTFTPIMFMWQPQTYTTYEGFSSISGKVEQYNDLVSPGSNALLYGTENIGVALSLNYYF